MKRRLQAAGLTCRVAVRNASKMAKEEKEAFLNYAAPSVDDWRLEEGRYGQMNQNLKSSVHNAG